MTDQTIKSLIGKVFGRGAGYLQIGIIALLVIMAFFFTRAPSKEDVISRSALADAAPAQNGQLVTVIQPKPVTSSPGIEATGAMEVRSYVTLSSQVGGRVIEVSDSLRAGGTFAAGHRLLSIEPNDFQLSLAQAQADVASAEATLKLRIAESDAAIENYALLNGNDEVPPLVAREPQIDQAKAQLSAAQAREDIASLAHARTRFSLPFAGRITESSIELGQLLSPGQSFGRAFSNDGVEASVPVTTEELKRISPAPGRAATIVVDNIPYAAVVDRVAAELDEQTRFARVYLKITVDNDVPPGSFVDVKIDGSDQNNTYVLPEAARQMNDTVWIVVDGQLQQTSLNVIADTSDGMVVQAFNYGDGVVLGSVPGARDGVSVTVASKP